MAKKSFNMATATAWMSQDTMKDSSQVETAETKEEKAETSAAESNDRNTEAETVEAEEAETPAEEAKKTKASKKSAENPVAKKAKQEAKFVLSPSRELKSRRTSVLLKTSIYDKIDQLAKSNNTSFNDCLNQILEQVLPE